MSRLHPPRAFGPAAILFVFGLLIGAPRIGWADPESSDPPAEEAPKEAAADQGQEPEPEPEAGLVKGLSWDVMAGGSPIAGAIIHAELGVTGLPRVAYHHSMRKGLSIGGSATLDWAYYTFSRPSVSLLLQVPFRYAVLRDGPLSIGVRADPGLFFNFGGSIFGILLNVGGNVGYTVDDRIIVGGGIEIPAVILFSGTTSGLVMPLLFGPIVEYHLSPPLAVTLDAKIGPHINIGGGSQFGVKLMVGVAYRI